MLFLVTGYTRWIMYQQILLRYILYAYNYTYVSLIGNAVFSHCLAFVYCGLSDEECLRLSARHNINGHFNHKMQHKDYVRMFLMLKYAQIYTGKMCH